MRKDELDPFAYIESAFIEAEETPAEEAPPEEEPKPQSAKDAPQPKEPSRSLVEAIRSASKPTLKNKTAAKRAGPPVEVKLKKTELSAPRPRRRRAPPKQTPIPEELEDVMQLVPKNLRFLSTVYDDDVTQKYYSTEFREPREDLIRRLVDPELSLEDTARLLGVCPATVRRYTNRGWLKHHRTKGNQRRFRLSGIVRFVETHGRNPE